jgi:hypothetical protein
MALFISCEIVAKSGVGVAIGVRGARGHAEAAVSASTIVETATAFNAKLLLAGPFRLVRNRCEVSMNTFDSVAATTRSSGNWAAVVPVLVDDLDVSRAER